MIGFGKEENNIKLSLFDVLNPNNPQEISKYLIEGDWTDSQALYDPKAFLFSKEKQILVLPISITNYGPIDVKENDTFTQQAGFWQGVYVFNSSPKEFTLRGTITHTENMTDINYYWVDSGNTINRAIYINNYLYTVSNLKIRISNLETLTFIEEVELS